MTGPVRCSGEVLVLGIYDGSMLAYCSEEGAWSTYDVATPLSLEAMRGVHARHDAECPGPKK